MSRGITVWALIAIAVLAWSTGVYPVRGGSPPANSNHFRLVVSEGVVGPDVNQSDVAGAMKAWSDSVVKELGFDIDVHVSAMPRLVREVRDHQVDGFSTTSPEFLSVSSYAGSRLILDENNAQGGAEYLVLVHEESGIRDLAGLRAKSLNVFDNRQMSMARIWLDTQFATAHLRPSDEYFSRIAMNRNLSRVVLPVYFRQTDACLAPRRGFNTMCELNPQLGRKLRVLANSPRFIASLMGFDKDCPPDRRERYERALTGLHKTLAGRQALTLFESTQLSVADVSAMTPALNLLKEHERLYGKPGPRN